MLRPAIGAIWPPWKRSAQNDNYVAPPPPAYYGPVSYGPPPWTPDWYAYCASRYRSFDPGTGYFMGYDGFPHFCQ